MKPIAAPTLSILVALLALDPAVAQRTPPATSPGAGGSTPNANGAGSEQATAPAANFALSRMIEMRPEDKRPLILNENERNPYARRSPRKENLDSGEENEEELEIRERLGSLSVTGRSRGPNGLRVLLGDIIIEQGRVLPQLLENQTEHLEVIQVDEGSIVLGWLDPDTGELTGRTMQMGYDLSPQINYALHGQSRDGKTKNAKDSTATPRMGVMRPDAGNGNRTARVAEDDAGSEESPPHSQAGR